MFTLNCKGKILSLGSPIVMGIINLTPDSFYEGQLGNSTEELLHKVEMMIKDGAAIIDIGGQSSRPGSIAIPPAEEIARVIPAISLIKKNYPDTIISIDTYYHQVAIEAVAAGATLVNDISAGEMDEQMIETVASLGVPYICMHMKGTPQTMQQSAVYDDVVREVLDFFIQKVEDCKKAGIKDIIIDPGFGFGKTASHNFQLLKELSVLGILKKPVLAGLSRKSTIYKTLGITAAEALNGTTVLNSIALLNGASILRVHDVKEAKEAIELVNAYKKAAP